jgi:CRISPR-associated protein Cmr2
VHDRFGELLSNNGSLTLSVGIAIGHFMENLEDLLGYGRAAEKAAKEPNRDGLAVHLHKRGGSPIHVRAKWTENPSPDHRLTTYARLILSEAIPSKLPYDLRKLADLYDNWPPDTVVTALRSDVSRVIRDKQPRSGRRYMAEIENALGSVSDGASLHCFARELLVARQIAASLRQPGQHPAHVAETAT